MHNENEGKKLFNEPTAAAAAAARQNGSWYIFACTAAVVRPSILSFIK